VFLKAYCQICQSFNQTNKFVWLFFKR